MNQRVSMADIARQLNISRATVSYVLNERESELISAATRARVLAAARELGYRPNRAAQALAGRKSHLIELCVRGFHPAFYSRMLNEYAQQFTTGPYELYIVNSRQWTDLDWEDADGGWPVDGIIAFDAYLAGRAIEIFQRRGVPLVTAGTAYRRDVDHVGVDLYEVSAEAVRYLLARRQRVAHLSEWSVAERDSRYLAYRDVMQEAGRPEEVIVVPKRAGYDHRVQVCDAMHEYIAQNGCPDAIFCFNDDKAIAVLSVLRDLKRRVPEDVALIGCDGIEETDYQVPPLSTIVFPYAEVAKLSWEFLQRRMAAPGAPLQAALLKPQLILRASSDC